MNKKMMRNTVGISIGAVGISEANKIPQYGGVISAAMAGGMVASQLPKKKKGWF